MLYIKDDIIKEDTDIIITIKGMDYSNPTKAMLMADGWKEYNISDYIKPVDELLQSKDIKLLLIYDYDKSDAVNSFTLNDINTWVGLEKRKSISNSLPKEKAVGRTESTIWLDDVDEPIVLPIDTIMDMLTKLEVYAYDCYNNTRLHISNVKKLKTKQEVEDYNFKTGYPDKLVFTI